jgi:hypothetical protein
MASGQEKGRAHGAENGRVLRPTVWRRQNRHIILGVSHSSNDPTQHRVFELWATFDAARGGWVAQIGEQDRNEQRGAWESRPSTAGEERVFPTAATCLGEAVATLIAMVDQGAAGDP